MYYSSALADYFYEVNFPAVAHAVYTYDRTVVLVITP